MVAPKSSASRPGGVVIGNNARLESEVSLSEYVLRYDSARQQLFLSGPNESEFAYRQRVSPAVLKVLILFAGSTRSAAISLSTSSMNGIDRLVRLDSNFVDTAVGRDLIAADLIAWRLRLPDLPDGRANPFSESFTRAYAAARSCMKDTSTRATLIDKPVMISISGSEMILKGGVRFEFMSDADDAADCSQASCKANPSGGKTCHLSLLERFAAGRYTQLVELFPPLRRVDEYAKLIGFLRWAARPGHLSAIDFSSLIGVSAFSEKLRTPDALTVE
jgi:hypothetical protein